MKSKCKIEIIPIKIEADVSSGRDIPDLILKSISQAKESLRKNDILIVTHKIISKAENRLVNLAEINPSPEAKRISKSQNKDPRFVELILSEAHELVKLRNGVMIAETRHGFICANAGIDSSNVSRDGNIVALLPVDSDYSASMIRKAIWNKR